MKNDDFNGQDYYGNYGSQFNDELANTLANARNSASNLMRELNQGSSVNDINRALKDEKDIDEDDSNKELGESREKDKNDELGEGDKDSKELGKESKKERSDELGEESDSEKHDELSEKDEDSDENDDKDSSDDSFDSGDSDEDSSDDEEEKDEEGKLSLSSLKSKAKRLKIMIILGAIGLFLSIAFIAAIVSTIAQPFSALVDTVSEFAEKIVETGGKIMNLFTFKGYGTNEDAFWKELDNQYNQFSSKSRDGEELDIALLAATIHYNVIIDSDYFESDNSDNSNSDNYNDGDYIVPEKKSSSFYDWAYDKLGNWNTLVFLDRGLSGALVSERYIGTCQPFTLKGWWDNKVNEVQSVLSSTITSFFETGKDVVQDLNLFTVINVWATETNRTGDPFGYLSKIIEDSKSAIENFGYDIKSVLTYDSIQCGYMEEPLDGACDTKNDDCTYRDGTYYKITKNTMPTYSRKFFNDYVKYNNYLRKFYLPRYYINCSNCAYKDYPEDKKKEIIESMIDDIYDLRNFYMESLGLDKSSNSIAYAPGAPTFVVQGPNHVTSNFGYRSDPATGKSTFHSGIDYGAACGTPIVAVADGVVADAKTVCANSPSLGYGTTVLIEHDLDGDGVVDFKSRYGHMQCDTLNVISGQKIGGGQQIGTVGSTGYSTGCHLHFETIVDGVKKNPEEVLKSLGIGG